MLKRKAKVITVSGGKGGTGKSFVAVNLAVELAKSSSVGALGSATLSNNRVLLFDADYHLSNSHLFLGVRQPAYLDSIVRNPKDILSYVVSTEYGVDLISFGGDDRRINDSELRFNDRILAELNKLEEFYDWIIVDTGAGLSRMIIRQIIFADHALLVINPESTSLLDAYKLVKFISLEKHRPKSVDICVNKVASMDEAVAAFRRLEGTKEQFGIKMKVFFAGAVYADKPGFDAAIARGVPSVFLDPLSHFAQSFDLVAKSVQRPSIVKKADSFFEKLFIDYSS